MSRVKCADANAAGSLIKKVFSQNLLFAVNWCKPERLFKCGNAFLQRTKGQNIQKSNLLQFNTHLTIPTNLMCEKFMLM